MGLLRLSVSAGFILLAVLLARYSWSVPLINGAERALYDIRATVTAPLVAQDKRIVLILFNEETLEKTGKRSPLDRGLLGRALAKIDAMGPKAIGIDILVDQAEPEDARLLSTLKAMRTPTFLAFATNATNPSFVSPSQERFLRRVQATLAGSRSRATMINLDTDPDGVVRHWPKRFPGLPAPLALALDPHNNRLHGYRGEIVFRQPRFADQDVYASFPVDLFDTPLAPALTSAIRGKYVLVGADLPDADRFATPATTLTRLDTFGLHVHADLLAQSLDGARPPLPPAWFSWLAAVLVVAAGGAAGAADTRRWWFWPSLVIEIALMIAAPLYLQWRGVDTRSLPMFGWLTGWALALTGIAAAARSLSAEQRQFAQSTLGKYLPRDVAQAILRDPERLRLSGEKRDIYALFTDLEGFTALSHRLEPETVASLINRYLDTLSDIVLAHGGTLDKFVGDAVVAFWGAPISRPDDADRAIAAAIALHEAGEIFRACPPEGVPPIGRTRVGLHRGSVIVGNFGGEGRIQYTAFGDAMNTASRLEAANKTLKSGVLVSDTVAKEASTASLRFLGRVVLRGRDQPIAVHEAGSRSSIDERAALHAAVARYDSGDLAALEEIGVMAARSPEDEALRVFVERLRAAGPGGHTVLT